MVLDPETSDDPDEDPDEAKALGFAYTLLVQQAQDIVANAISQQADASADQLVKAFNYYHEHDAFVLL
jgi:hypothetical protein